MSEKQFKKKDNSTYNIQIKIIYRVVQKKFMM